MSVLRLDIRVGHSVQQQLSDARAFVSRETSCHMQRIQTIQLQQRRGGEERRGGGAAGSVGLSRGWPPVCLSACACVCVCVCVLVCAVQG